MHTTVQEVALDLARIGISASAFDGQECVCGHCDGLPIELWFDDSQDAVDFLKAMVADEDQAIVQQRSMSDSTPEDTFELRVMGAIEGGAFEWRATPMLDPAGICVRVSIPNADLAEVLSRSSAHPDSEFPR